MEGKQLLLDGRAEEGFSRLEEVVKQSPDNVEYKSYLYNQRGRFINQWLAQANSVQLNSQFDEAELLYRRVLNLDPQNQRAQAGLDSLVQERRHRLLLDEAQAQQQKASWRRRWPRYGRCWPTTRATATPGSCCDGWRSRAATTASSARS
ncbi:hypothetical protein ACFSQE_15370 [Vogesella fluminis]|uniref:hypothetical protein n=1 Tax=Vogesella fluminis TaxID=1069161 RepID=UPI003642D5F4